MNCAVSTTESVCLSNLKCPCDQHLSQARQQGPLSVHRWMWQLEPCPPRGSGPQGPRVSKEHAGSSTLAGVVWQKFQRTALRDQAERGLRAAGRPQAMLSLSRLGFDLQEAVEEGTLRWSSSSPLRT